MQQICANEGDKTVMCAKPPLHSPIKSPSSSVMYKHTACISFWIPKRQAISTDTSFEIKMMVKIYAIEIIFRSHEPFQSYLLTRQADSAKKAG